MNLELIRTALGWAVILNILLLMLWFALFLLGRDLMLRLHGRWFKLSPEVFDAMHYAGMGMYKLAIWMLLLIPYLVLRFCI